MVNLMDQIFIRIFKLQFIMGKNFMMRVEMVVELWWGICGGIMEGNGGVVELW
jgi:hypothetical protein